MDNPISIWSLDIGSNYYGNTVLEWMIAFGVIISSFFVAKLH